VERPEQGEWNQLWIDTETVHIAVDTCKALGMFWVRYQQTPHDYAISNVLHFLLLLLQTQTDFISERELTFTFAIGYHPSVCLSSVCL